MLHVGFDFSITAVDYRGFCAYIVTEQRLEKRGLYQGESRR